MTTTEPIPTAEELSSWPTAAEAYEALRGKFGESTGAFIGGRLIGGKIAAISEDASWESKEQEAELLGITKISTFMFPHVSPDDWRDLWAIGDLRVSIRDSFVRDPNKTVIRYFSVRFSPTALAPILAGGGDPAPEPSDQDQRGPRVTEPDLLAWHALYVQVYGGTPEDTLRNAVKSAQGMFQGKSVARDRVRILCAGRKRGPKAVTSAE